MMSKEKPSAVMRVVCIGVVCAFCTGLFISCGTTGAAGQAGGADTEPLPVWVLNPPVDEEYFLGIGGSNTGNREADMEQARLAALADLAARISTKIRGEMVLESGEDDRGNRRQSFSRRIEENVSQELRGVEPVDAYYSPEEGFWYYYRFPKAELDRARDDLKRRVRDLVFPREGSADAAGVTAGTAAERLTVLGRGFDLIMESPFVGTLRVEEVRYTGALIDYIEAELRRELGSLEISLADGVISGESGDFLVLEARVRAAGAAEDGRRRVPGRIPLILMTREGKILGRFVTGPDGRYSGTVEAVFPKPGRYPCIVSLDVSALIGEVPAGAALGVSLPKSECILEIFAKSLALEVRTEEGTAPRALTDGIKAILETRLEYDLTGEYDPEKSTLLITVYYSDFPESEYGMYFSTARGVLDLVRSGRSLYSFETDRFKEGGLTVEQARDRALGRLFQYLENTAGPYREITSILEEE